MIEVLKQALEALYLISHNSTDDYRGQADKAITSLLQAIAELESQEPVAWRLNGESSLGHGKVFGDWKSGNPPADVADLASVDKNWSLEFAYTTPPAQRTWVGLTLEQYVAINSSCVTVDEAIGSTERQLKENNNA